jgi:hypothetical protein
MKVRTLFWVSILASVLMFGPVACSGIHRTAFFVAKGISQQSAKTAPRVAPPISAPHGGRTR